MVQSIAAFCERVQQGLTEATFEQKRHVIELLVDRVVVTGEEVEIRYVIPTSQNSEQIRFCQLRLDYFNRPVLAIQFQKTLGIRLFSGDAGHPVNHLYSLLTFLPDLSSDQKDLCNPTPLFLEPFVHLGTGPNFPHFESSMSFIHFLMVPKFTPVDPFIGEEFTEMATNRRIVLLDGDDIIPIRGMDRCTPLSTTEDRISTDDASFHE